MEIDQLVSPFNQSTMRTKIVMALLILKLATYKLFSN